MAISSLNDKRIMTSAPAGLNAAPPAFDKPNPPVGPAMPPLYLRPKPMATQAKDIGIKGPTPMMGTPRKGPIEVATSDRAAAATASLAKPMSQLRSEAYGGEGFQGPMPAPRGPSAPMMGAAGPMGPTGPSGPAQRPMLGSMTMKNLQPRAGGATPMLPRPAGGAMAPQSAAGFTTYFDEMTGGAPQQTRRGRAGLRFTSGPSRGKTQGEAGLSLREQYAKLSPEEKARYESKANLMDISSPSQAPVAAPAATPNAAGGMTQPAPVSPAAEIKSLTNEDLDLNQELAMKRRVPIKPMLPRTMMA